MQACDSGAMAPSTTADLAGQIKLKHDNFQQRFKHTVDIAQAIAKLNENQPEGHTTPMPSSMHAVLNIAGCLGGSDGEQLHPVRQLFKTCGMAMPHKRVPHEST